MDDKWPAYLAAILPETGESKFRLRVSPYKVRASKPHVTYVSSQSCCAALPPLSQLYVVLTSHFTPSAPAFIQGDILSSRYPSTCDMLCARRGVEDPFRHQLPQPCRHSDAADLIRPSIQRWKKLKQNRSNLSQDYGSQPLSQREQSENTFPELQHEDIYAGIKLIRQERIQIASNLTATKSDTGPELTHYPPPTPCLRP
jgi:hypothetical protein